MSKRIIIIIIFAVLVAGAIVTYFALTYQSKEQWLKDYLYEVYGGEQWVKVGKDGNYYAYRAGLGSTTYENGVFKDEKALEHCLQPERDYYTSDDIIMSTDKSVYQYGKEPITFTITNNSHKTIWPTGDVWYDIEVKVNGQWYAIYLWEAYSYGTIFDGELNPGNKMKVTIPIYIQGFAYFDVYKSGMVYTEPNYYVLRPGLYRIVHRFSFSPQGKYFKFTYLTCTFEIMK